MRKIITLAAVFFLTTVTAAQMDTIATSSTVAREELQKLIGELNAAWQQRDRAALERIYADDFVFIHASGYIDNKTTHIEEGLSAEYLNPIPMPAFEDLHIWGDVAVDRFRGGGGTAASYGTSIYVKTGGQWRILQIQGTRLLPEREPVRIDPDQLDAYVGKYHQDSGTSLVILREGETLLLQLRGVPNRLLIPASSDRFFTKLGQELKFYKGENGTVSHFVIKLQDGLEKTWKRVE